MARQKRIKSTTSNYAMKPIVSSIISFLLGCSFCMTLITLNYHNLLNVTTFDLSSQPKGLKVYKTLSQSKELKVPSTSSHPQQISSVSLLAGKKILVAIASFDFLQLSHLEEVLDGYVDLCVSGIYFLPSFTVTYISSSMFFISSCTNNISYCTFHLLNALYDDRRPRSHLHTYYRTVHCCTN